jgi:hypothetical protein
MVARIKDGIGSLRAISRWHHEPAEYWTKDRRKHRTKQNKGVTAEWWDLSS